MRRLFAFLFIAACASAQEQTYHWMAIFPRGIDGRAADGSTAPFRHVTADLVGLCGGAEFGWRVNVNNKKVFWCNPSTGSWELAFTIGATGGGGSSTWGSITGTLSAQTDLQAALDGKASLTGSYSNPSWITALAWAKLTGVPSTFPPSTHTHPSTDITDWNAAVRAVVSGTAGRIAYNSSTGVFDLASGIATPGTYTSVTVDTYGRVTAGTNPGGSGITSLGASGQGQTGATQTLAVSFVNGTAWGVSSSGNVHTFNFPIATTIQAEDGVVDNVIMTPAKTAAAIAALTPLPAVQQLGYIVFNGTENVHKPFWSIPPAAGAITAAGNSITCTRAAIDLTPSSSLTLTSTPTILDGEDGQICTVRNLSTTNSLTLQDAVNLAGSGLRLGGSNVTIAPRGAETFMFSLSLDTWTRITTATGGASSGQILKEVEFKSGCQNSVPITTLMLFNSPGTAGVTPEPKCVFGTDTILGVVEFASDGQYGTGSFRLPTGTTNLSVIVESRTAATTGNTVYTLTSACVAPGEAMGTGTSDTPAGGPTLSNSNTITIAAGTANVSYASTEAVVPFTGCAANETLHFKIARSASTTVASPPGLTNLIFRAKN